MNTTNILLVEDNEGDIHLTKEAFGGSEYIKTINVVRNGDTVIDFVSKSGIYKEALTPDLILLDINLPKKNGFEVLQVIKAKEATKMIPVVVFSTSSAQKDINLAYQHHANGYIIKPIELEEFIEAVSKIEGFWIQLIQTPKT